MENPLSSNIQIYLQNYNIYLITMSNGNPFGKDLQFNVHIDNNRATISGIQTTIAVLIILTIQ